MSEEERGVEGAPQGATPPGTRFEILKIYTKDVSFETPHSPAIFRVEWKPDVNLNLHSAATQIAAGQYEVVLSVTVTVAIGEQTAFLAEAQVAGIFAITGLTQQELDPVLGSACPGMLYPYARELVSDLTTRGGFPQCLLAPVNFDALYMRHRDGRAEGGEPGPEDAATAESG